VLLELCNAAVTIPSSAVHNVREEDQDANGQDKQQRQLFEEPLPALGVQLPQEVTAQLRQTLMQWMQAQVRESARRPAMNKITAEHLSRQACVYIRQSTPGQVRHNLESQRRQYALVDHARSLGWENVEVIDEDLGISGSGTRRPGFERLLRALCDGQVGAVFSIEASRWRAMAGTGTRFWSSAAWSARC
jgi:hypothetical protein